MNPELEFAEASHLWFDKNLISSVEGLITNGLTLRFNLVLIS